MDLVVRPDQRGRGLGTTLLDFLVESAREADATSLQARPLAEQADALTLLAARDFRETMRMYGLALDDVRAVQLPPDDWYEGKLAERGIRVTTLARELVVDPDAWTKLRDANQAAQSGWLDPDPPPNGRPREPQSVEQFRAQSDDFRMIPEACFIALDREQGGQYVGYSALALTDAGGLQAGSSGTAVRPEYRAQGVATALKARCVRWAQENGVRRLATSSGHPAMVHVNEKFGFRRTYEEVRLVRRPV
jgi:GNAT superfamily N-acetyltransferase